LPKQHYFMIKILCILSFFILAFSFCLLKAVQLF
jgi:hypothetical protein